ncbi:hypothetical protein WS70_26485 [Burkholderia mayonis]|uniref:Uncharacterized protein n=1 Tax=Burkholderia mayonis TaxID=1385591 RepID=A0A1B4FNL8_9BURK|nr:hypothetical protein WS70_26485 [Burkholderia mayonis]
MRRFACWRSNRSRRPLSAVSASAPSVTVPAIRGVWPRPACATTSPPSDESPATPRLNAAMLNPDATSDDRGAKCRACLTP